MDATTKYEKKLRKKYPTIYKDIKGKVDKVPDQRLFEDNLIKSELKEWTPYLIWKSLYYELEILYNADERGDYDDNSIFKIINTPINPPATYQTKVDNYHIDSIEISDEILSGEYTSNVSNTLKYGLTNFFATYPILSYLFIHINKNYPLAIIGRHPIIIKEIVATDNWTEKYGLFTLSVPELIIYSTNKHDINLLLDNVDIAKEYVNICQDAVNVDNKILFIELWKRLKIFQKKDTVFVIGIAKFDLLDILLELENIDKSLINDEVWYEVLRFGATDTLTYLLDNYKITNLEIIYSALSDVSFNKNVYLTLKLLSQNYDLQRFYGKYDLLKTIIDTDDFDVVKLAVELEMNMRDGIIVNNKPISPLLVALNKPTRKEIANYLLLLYGVNEDELLCAAVKNDMGTAVSYLLETVQYSNRELEEALSYVNNMDIMHELLSYLNVIHRNIPDVFDIDDN